MMKGQLGNLMQQAQKLQEKMQTAQQELQEVEAQGEAGAGMVTVTMSGTHEIKRIKIDDQLMDDREMLEDLVTAAVNDAVQRVQKLSKDKMSEAAGGLPLPPGLFG